MGVKRDEVQEQLVRLRREQILGAAGKVFSEKGYHSSKMKDVAKAAGVSNGTVYNYFASKEEVLLALLDELNETELKEGQMAQFLELEASGVRDMFVAVFRARLAYLWPRMECFRAVLPEALSNPVLREKYYEGIIGPGLKMGEEAFGAMVKAGLLRDVDVSLLTRTMAATMSGMLLLKMLGDEGLGEDLGVLAEGMADLFFEKLGREGD